jgi:outer membrane protein OmpA-like peptidoglycan-associated protein
VTVLPSITRLALAAGLALLAGCGAHVTKDSASRLGQAVRPEMRIAQLDYGRKAHYAVCAEPACPTVTPKSLAAAAPGVPTSVSRSAVSSAPSVVSEISRKVSAAPPQETPSPAMPEKSLDVSAETRTPAPHMAPVIVHFKWNSHELTAEAIETLDHAMDTARHAARIDIAGRTDNTGPEAANAAMALHRALAIREYLTQHLPASHGEIVIDAKGDCCFIASNDTWAGRHENRRVEIVFTPRAESDHDTR